MKFYRYKQLQRLTFFGYDDILHDDVTTFSKKSPYSRTVDIPAVPAVIAGGVAAIPYTEAVVGVPGIPAVPPVDNDTQLLRFNINRLFQTPLSQNAKIGIEQLYLPAFEAYRTGPITVRMNNLNTHSHDSQNNVFNKTLIYTTEAGDVIFENHNPEMLHNFSISQNFFQNGYVEFEIQYPDNDIYIDSLDRFYISFVVYDIDEQELLLKDTPDVDFKQFGPHIGFQNKK